MYKLYVYIYIVYKKNVFIVYMYLYESMDRCDIFIATNKKKKKEKKNSLRFS